MGNYACYATRADLKTTLDVTDTTDDAELLSVLEDVSEWIDDYCGRHFSVRSETRYFTARRRDRLLIDDLLSLTTLAHDEDEDLDYDYTWASGDYLLEPVNRFPRTAIHVHPNGNYDFPAGLIQGVKVIGLWGHGNGHSATPYRDSGTDTAEVLDATETGVDVVDGTALAVGQTILVESEQMYITAISSNTLTVERGVNGTTAATHATAKDVYIYQYPRRVARACLIQAARIAKRPSAPFGVIGSPEFGHTAILARLDPDVREYLSRLRHPSVAA